MNNPTAIAVDDLVQIAFRQYGGTECDSIILRGKKIVMITDETTIDKSYDQTAYHAHIRGVECPQCNTLEKINNLLPANNPPTANIGRIRHVSPAIMEHRIERLEQELKAEKQSHGITTAERDVARSRIKQFERFNEALSKKVDLMLEKFEAATDKNPIEFLYPNLKSAA